MISTSLKSHINEQKKKLDQASSQLKKEFIGLDHIIDEIISLLSPWFVFPDAQMRPTVVNLWGMTGTGKTALVSRLVELLEFGQAYVHVDVGEYGNSSSDVWLKNMLTEDLKHHHSRPAVICLDEFQFARTINEDRHELDKDKLRVIWELIDSGKFYYNSTPDQYYLSKTYKAIELLQKCKDQGVVLQNGKITQNLAAFREHFKGFSFYYHGSNKKAIEANYFISSEFVNSIFDMVGERYTSTYELEDIIKTLDLDSLGNFLQDAAHFEGSLKLMDLSQAAIFIIGNLDEAFYMSSNINPDISADEFYKSTLKINISDIKGALQNRFRNEQIARLGNNHIIYPAFNSGNYYKLIAQKVEDVRQYAKEKFRLDFEFDQSVADIIYQEGVFPTQGARPVLTTIKNLVETYLSKILFDLLEEDVLVKSIFWQFDGEQYVITAKNELNKIVFTKNYPLNLKVNTLRKSQNDDVQAHVAVHESGHAILAVLTTRILPELVVTQTVDNQMAGFCQIRFPEKLLTRSLLRKKIMIALGGFLAEKMIFGEDDTSTGVIADLKEATELANEAIKKYGMGHTPTVISVKDADYNEYFFHKKVHEQQALQLITTCQQEAAEMLENNKLLLLEMASYLTLHSRMDRNQIKDFVCEYGTETWIAPSAFKEPEDYFKFKEKITDQLEELREMTQVPVKS